jgi:hypothetical protein
VEKHGRSGQAIDDSIILGMRFTCWLPKATDAHSEYVILCYHGDSGYANSPRCYFYTSIAWLVGTDVMSSDMHRNELLWETCVHYTELVYQNLVNVLKVHCFVF